LLDIQIRFGMGRSCESTEHTTNPSTKRSLKTKKILPMRATRIADKAPQEDAAMKEPSP
jgi:hypothetical protein